MAEGAGGVSTRGHNSHELIVDSLLCLCISVCVCGGGDIRAARSELTSDGSEEEYGATASRSPCHVAQRDLVAGRTDRKRQLITAQLPDLKTKHTEISRELTPESLHKTTTMTITLFQS